MLSDQTIKMLIFTGLIAVRIPIYPAKLTDLKTDFPAFWKSRFTMVGRRASVTSQVSVLVSQLQQSIAQSTTDPWTHGSHPLGTIVSQLQQSIAQSTTDPKGTSTGDKVKSSMSDKKLNSHSSYLNPPLPLKTKYEEYRN
jgi:hypothetical protein